MQEQKAEFITVVSGLPRSGTSMMMRMLESGGVPVLTDGVRAADTDNPKGYFEYEPVKRLEKDSSWLAEAYGKSIKVIYVFLYHLPPEHQYKVIFIRRNLEEVIASQKTMLRGRQQQGGSLTDQQLMDSFEMQLQRLHGWLKMKDNFSVFYLDYHEVLGNPEKAAIDITRFLGLPLNVERMIHSVDPSLHRNRSSAAT